MKKLLLPLLFIFGTSFTMEDSDSLKTSNDVMLEKNIFSEFNISKFEINVSEVEYSRNINSVSHSKEKRKTGTVYYIDIESREVNVNFSDGTSVFFDSVSISVNKNVYEISFFDQDMLGNASKLYSTIIVDVEKNSVDYIERTLDYVNDYNLYRFTKFNLKFN